MFIVSRISTIFATNLKQLLLMIRSVGIDFGTSTTVVKVQNDSKNNMCPVESLTFNGHPTVPTLVFLRPSETEPGKTNYYFGYEAEAMCNNGIKGEMKRSFKMNLVSNNEQEQEEARYLTKKFFEYLHETYAHQSATFGRFDQETIYVSYPAKWPSEVRLFMKQCAIEAGFGTNDTVIGVDEPTAAVLASLSENLSELQAKKVLQPDVPANVMMVDMGAGTTDIAIFKMKVSATADDKRPSIYDVVTYPVITCDYFCGGREIDAILDDWVRNYIASIRQPPKLSKGREKKIHDTISQWKDTIVSPQLAAEETICTHPVLAGYKEELIEEGFELNSNVDPFRLGRAEFESLTRSHWEAWRNLLLGALAEAQRCGYSGEASDIDFVILAGGHSQWYGVKDFLLGKSFAGLPSLGFTKIETEPVRLLQSQRAHETVAKGLCLYDSEFDIKQVTANNVWIRFMMGTIVTDWQKAIDKNVTLPYNADQLTFKISTRSNSFIKRKAVTIVCETCQGESLADGRLHSTEINFPAEGDIEHLIFNVILGGLLSPFAILDVLFHLDDVMAGKGAEVVKNAFAEDRVFHLKPVIKAGTDGIIRVSGEITCSTTSIKLTEHQI